MSWEKKDGEHFTMQFSIKLEISLISYLICKLMSISVPVMDGYPFNWQ